MPRGADNYKRALTCWLAMFAILIAGQLMIHREPVVLLDAWILDWLAARRTPALDRFFAFIAWAGSSFFLLPMMFAIAVTQAIRKHIQEALFLTGSFVGAIALSNAAKLVFARPRPNGFPAVIDLPAGFSFPSSHAVQISAFVLALLLVLKVSTGARRLIVPKVLGGLLILLVCFSRLYLQVHYPTDVATGFLAALFWVAGLAALMLPDH